MAEPKYGYSAHDFTKVVSLPYSHCSMLVRLLASSQYRLKIVCIFGAY